MKTLQDYKEEYIQLHKNKSLSQNERDLEAVKRNGYALKHVKNQTPEICYEAVKQNEDVLKFVNPKFFQ